MIAVLRPFLKNRGMAGDGGYWMVEGNPPLRACDTAAIAIKQILAGKAYAPEPIGMPGMPYRNLRDSYPKWDEWDKTIAELQKQLDALETALNFIHTNFLDTAEYEMAAPEAIQRIPTAWRVSWRHKVPAGAAAIKGGQLVIVIHDSGKTKRVMSE